MAKIAWIGLGNMGSPMSTNLVKAGNEVCVWNRSKEKAASVVEAGAKLSESPAGAAKGAEFIFTMISDSNVLEEVVLGAGGILESLTAGQIVIDMSTVSLQSSKKVNEAIEGKGAKFLRAPVSGSTVLAAAGGLTVLCSGPKDAFETTKPLFEKISKVQFYLGGGDEARIMKLSLNMMIATSLEMLAESLTLGEKAGLDWNTMLDVIGGSVLASPLINYKTGPIREKKYNPAFTARLMAKDLELALGEAKGLGVFTPVTAITKQMLESACANGKGELDFASLITVVEEMSGVK